MRQLTSVIPRHEGWQYSSSIMEDKYSRRHKSSRKSSKRKHGDKSKKSKRKHKHERSKNNKEDIKTPPLPTNPDNTIENLLKRRELLQKQLENMGNSCKPSTNYDNDDITSSKRSKHYQEHNMFKKQKTGDITIYENLDSEDEESIIEQRRRQRKMLLEKLAPIETQNDDPNNVSTKKDNNISSDKKRDVETESDKKENDVTDMFSEKDDFSNKPGKLRQDTSDNSLIDNWDDPNGYYNIRVGDHLNDNRYIIKSLLGQGMFANVVRAQDKFKSAEVAIKIARNNDLMYRNGLKEIVMLKEIDKADPEGKHHCVKLLRHFMHRGHLCIVLESLSMDLRCVMKKYGKNYGLSINALISYSKQLLVALRLLKKVGIVHADIKPDNILVNEARNVLKLCDFGSAERVGDGEPRPYLVSRYYRAPEIILGAMYGHCADLWSTGCTIYEIATGRIMFTGGSNNKMLKCFMDLKGRIPNKLLRRGKFKDQHFNYNNNFLMHSKDPVTGREKVNEITNITVTRNLQNELKKYCKNLSPSEEVKLTQLKDLLDKMLMLDPNQRVSISECIKHAFIQEALQ